jgi:hypothetical protein
MIDLEHLSDEELAELQERFSQLALKARNGKSPCEECLEEVEEKIEEEVEEEIEERAEKRVR